MAATRKGNNRSGERAVDWESQHEGWSLLNRVRDEERVRSKISDTIDIRNKEAEERLSPIRGLGLNRYK